MAARTVVSLSAETPAFALTLDAGATVPVRTVVMAHGGRLLEQVTWTDRSNDAEQILPMRNVFPCSVRCRTANGCAVR